MSESFNLDPVTTITAGAVGEPGGRTFYLQARSGDLTLSLLLEKQQVEALARSIDALLARLSATHPADETEEGSGAEVELDEPIVPAFRVGSMALGYDAERDLVLLQCDEMAVADDEEDDEDDDDDEELETGLPGPPSEGATARFWATREQMRGLARTGASVVAAGRPRCRLCGLPIDPDGHFCPSTNGHRELSGPL